MNSPNTTTVAATVVACVGLALLCGTANPVTGLPTAAGGLPPTPSLPEHHNRMGILPAEPCLASPPYLDQRRGRDSHRLARHIAGTTPDQTHWDEEPSSSEEANTSQQELVVMSRDADGGIVFKRTEIDPDTGTRTVECWHYGCKIDVRTV